VEYGTSTSYGSAIALDGTRVTAHSQTLSGLTPSTLYHYRVRSRDTAGNLAVSGDFTFTTSVQQFTLTVTVNRILLANGTVTSSPIGINCGSDCLQGYNSGTTVTLTATPTFGSVFVGWGGDCSGILVPTCTVNMTGNRSVTATFGP
jgi:uncharacterized repeat protein (TIGR02543 family)